MWQWFWRCIAFGALALSCTSCFFVYEIWKNSDLKPVAAGRAVDGSLDVIALQIDILSVTMAAVGFALAVAGLIGYQSIREASIRRAEELAGARADDVATKAIALHLENMKRTLDGLGSGDGKEAVEPPLVESTTIEDRE